MPLSALATRRLMKEMAAPPSDGYSLQPLDGDLSRWHGNLMWEGSCLHLLLEIPDSYPTAAPALFFRTDVPYTGGAKSHVSGKGTEICLDLLGNFASYHRGEPILSI